MMRWNVSAECLAWKSFIWKKKYAFNIHQKCHHETGHIYKIYLEKWLLAEDVDIKYWKLGDNRGQEESR